MLYRPVCSVAERLPHLGLQAGQELQTEREAREDAAAAVAKLESVISVVRNEMMEAQEAANKVCGLFARLPTKRDAMFRCLGRRGRRRTR